MLNFLAQHKLWYDLGHDLKWGHVCKMDKRYGGHDIRFEVAKQIFLALFVITYIINIKFIEWLFIYFIKTISVLIFRKENHSISC